MARGFVRKPYHSSVRVQRAGSAGGRGVARRDDVDRRRLDLRMPRRPGADEPPVPRPVALGVGGRVDADVAVAGADVGLERGLLRRVEHVAGREQEDDGVVRREAGGA